MRRYLSVFLLIIYVLASCSGGGGGSDSVSTFTTGRDTPKRVAIDDYLNKVAVPILVQLDNSALELRRLVSILLANPSEANFVATKAAWVAARVPWERNRSTNFGPLVSENFNARINSWPIDVDGLEDILAGGGSLSEGAVSSLPGSLKGFHIIEYLLWGPNGIKRAPEITQREALLLTSAVAVLRNDTLALLNSWNRSSNPYAEQVALAGQGSDAFETEDQMLETVVRGMIAVFTEIANSRLEEDDFEDVESHYSGNSLTEFIDVVVGGRDIYNIAISQLVEDESVDLEVRGQFELAINSLRLIPEPFDAAIGSSANDQRISNARRRIRNLIDSLNNGVLPLFIEQMPPVEGAEGATGSTGAVTEGGGDVVQQ
jgi:hypothetical protein